MKNMRSWLLGAAMAVAGLGLIPPTAQAAEFRVHVRGPVAYVPPCPGPGYAWTAGYYANGCWVPGFWNFVGVRVGGPYAHYDRGPVFRGYVDRGHERFRR
ncbi:MAG: hypothetical protein ABR956_12475 [Terracidiphilus sp.]|jgi:hypothetical protein